jgi:hypothetical protein
MSTGKENVVLQSIDASSSKAPLTRCDYLVVGSSVVVGGGVAVSANGRGMVSALDRLGGVRLVTSVTWRSNGRAGVGGVVARAVVVRSGSGQTAGGSWDGTNFRVAVTCGAVGLLALPELHARALGVAVVGARTECLLLLVVLHQHYLDKSADQEEECADDGDSEAGCVQVARRAQGSGIGDLPALAVGAEALLAVRRTVAQWCADVALAG